MKKIVKLSESELVDLVKKIVKEQEDGPAPKGQTKPSSSSLGERITPIQIKMVLPTKKGDQTYLVSLDKVKKVKDGCEFEGVFRGDEKRHSFHYMCDGSFFWKQGILASNTEVEISADAGKLLMKACGCQAYASNQTAGGMQSQMAEDSEMNEAAPEPIVTGEPISIFVFGFPEGKAAPNMANGALGTYSNKSSISSYVRDMASQISESGIVPVLEKYMDSGKLPKFIHIHVGTSHTGSGEANASVAEARFQYLENVVANAMKILGIDASVVKTMITRDSDTIYTRSKLNKNFYDPKLKQPKAYERFGEIVIFDLQERGLDTKGIQNVQRGLNRGSSVVNTWVADNVSEDVIVNNIQKLQSFSDIIDLSNSINAGGNWMSLEDFLNDQLFDDAKEMTTVASHLKKLAVRSNKQSDTIRLYRGGNGLRISIGLGK